MKLSALLALALFVSATAHAVPQDNETVWLTNGKAVYTEPSGIFWSLTKVKEIDGSTLTIGCQSGPFTPYAVDGRITFSDVTVIDAGRMGQPVTKGIRAESRKYARTAEECYGVLKWFANEINKRGGRARIILNNTTGEVNVE